MTQLNKIVHRGITIFFFRRQNILKIKRYVLPPTCMVYLFFFQILATVLLYYGIVTYVRYHKKLVRLKNK